MWSISPSFREAIEHSESSMSRDRAIVGKCYRSQSSFRSMTKTKSVVDGRSAGDR